jgi:hypothetical protein
MAKPAFMFHRQTGMKFKYVPKHPMLSNPMVVLLDDKGNQMDARPKAPRMTLRVPKKPVVEEQTSDAADAQE